MKIITGSPSPRQSAVDVTPAPVKVKPKPPFVP
jgi:hypothetical protein